MSEFVWPTMRGVEVRTVIDPNTSLKMCKDCWHGMHAKDGSKCKTPGCECGCYHGKVKSKNGLHKPHKSVDSDLPDVGSFEV